MKKNIFSKFKLRLLNLKENHQILIIGPEAKKYLKYFKKNYYYVDPSSEVIFSGLLFVYAIIFFFFYLIKKPFFLIKIFRLWPKIFFIIALIKIKKIKKIISLVDYNPWPNNLKKIIGKSVTTIGLQNSSKAYPLEPCLIGKDYDLYFTWNNFENELITDEIKKKFIQFGSLKSFLVLKEKNLWSNINKFPKKSETNKNLVLISTFHESYFPIYYRFLNEKNIDLFEKKLSEIELKFLTNKNFGKIKNLEKREKKIPKRFFIFQSIEFFKMCLYLRKYFNDQKINLFIIERNYKGVIGYNEEKLFFSRLFGKDYRLKLNHFEKIEFILKKMNYLYLTNISSLGRECLSFNRKSMFFSSLLHYYNPQFFDKKSNFCSINDDYYEFKNKLNNLFQLDEKKFLFSKKNLKKTITSFTPTKKNLKDFLEYTGLVLNEKK